MGKQKRGVKPPLLFFYGVFKRKYEKWFYFLKKCAKILVECKKWGVFSLTVGETPDKVEREQNFAARRKRDESNGTAGGISSDCGG